MFYLWAKPPDEGWYIVQKHEDRARLVRYSKYRAENMTGFLHLVLEDHEHPNGHLKRY